MKYNSLPTNSRADKDEVEGQGLLGLIDPNSNKVDLNGDTNNIVVHEQMDYDGLVLEERPTNDEESYVKKLGSGVTTPQRRQKTC